jgi:hypothetical protein
MGTERWEELYRAAVLETDWSKMEERINATEIAMRERLHEFSLNHGGTAEENRAILDAVNSLKVLRSDLAAWQDKS